MKIAVSIATTPDRELMFQQVVQAFVGQTTQLNCYLDGYTEVPKWLINMSWHFKDLLVEIGNDEIGNYHGAGKFFWTEQLLDHVYITVDDDIKYPPDYVDKMISALERHPKSIVGVHGIRIRKPIQGYYRSRQVWMYSLALKSDSRMHCLGTGTLAFRPKEFLIRSSNFSMEAPQMCDIVVGKRGQELGVPLWCVSRPHRWLTDIPNSGSSVYKRFVGADDQQTTLAKSVSWEKL